MSDPIPESATPDFNIQGGLERALSIAELTTLLIKHFDVKEGLWEASFSIGIMVGGFSPDPRHPPFPGAAVVTQGVSLQPVPVATPHSVDASTVK